MRSLSANFGAKDIPNEPGKAVDHTEDDIFTNENFGQSKIENQHAHNKVRDLVKDPPVQELVESVPFSQFPESDTIQYIRNGDDSTDINGSVDQRKLVIQEKQGVKRSREECDRIGSSVHVVYSSLPSRSKRKLEELLSHWSDWHAKHCASAEDPANSLESGKETYFPALHVGSGKPSTVSFSMDVPELKRECKKSVSLNQEFSPLYDRGFAVGLACDAVAGEERGVDLREPPRCFNCSSYNHRLSGCTKPFSKVAVNSAKKEFQSKNRLNGKLRVLTRYFQDSPGGKFDGIIPGALSAETRMLLGLWELDPPPWLDRMCEMGYPPGYLDPDEEDQPSGITIFGDEETQNVDVRSDPRLGLQKSQKKMVIDFPGINAPIPENADQSLWVTSRGSDEETQNVDVRSDPRLGLQKSQKKMMIDFPGINSPIPENADQSLWVTSRGPVFPEYALKPRDIIAIGRFCEAHNIDSPLSPFCFESPPFSQHPYNYYPSEPFSPIGVPIPQVSPFGFESPPVCQRPYNYYPSEPFSPRGVPSPVSPRYGRPFMHYNHGSF